MGDELTPDQPYEWAHPQFDPDNHRQWSEFRAREPYVGSPGLVYLPAKP